MPAAMSRGELLAKTEKDFWKLSTLLDKIDAGTALIKDADDTSIKDVVGHRAHWIELFLGWYESGLAGEEVYFPAKGYKWNQLKQYNADLRAKQSRLSWKKAKETLQASHEKLLGFIGVRSDHELYGGPMLGANNSWTPGRWAEAAGPSHYRSAAKYIRGRLKELSV
ncbi:MAG: ClbS/DfsB family four-helix bundle protein [Pseudomonadota bacterium]